jgi:hypothetical protein
MVAGDLRQKLTLAEAKTGVVAVGFVPKYTDSDVELMLEYTDLASDVARMASQSNSDAYIISFGSFTNFALSLETGAAGMNILILALLQPQDPIHRHPRNGKDFYPYSGFDQPAVEFLRRYRAVVLLNRREESLLDSGQDKYRGCC